MGAMAHPAPTANDLLAHTDWLHQLARALVGDAAAGDVVQQTYEIALTHPPKREGALRPWLGGVARNVARMTTRGRVRRQRREDAVVATPTADVPTPEELVARVQLHQRVASIVLGLHEPLRSTLLLRFFEGMSAAEIARAQGIPAATVRSRLQDALARVRETLDEEHRGDRRAWAVVLVPSIAAVPSGSAALAGGMLVKTGLKIVVALVVAAVLVVGARFAGLWGGDGGATATPPAPLAKPAIPSAPPATTPPARAAAAGPRELPAFHDADPQGTLRLEGQVIDEHDAPVAGALVAIDSNPPRVVETEGDGSFAFDGLIPRDYHVESSRGDGYAGPAWLRLGPDAEPVTLRMRRGGTVEVVVTDKRDGSAVEGAEVELRSALTWKATTDAAGIATLRGVGPTWSPLAVRAAGFAPAAMMLGASGAPAAPDRVSISLARGAALSGRVVDERGKPVGGARVVATSASEPMPVVDPRRDGVLAAADGTFTLASVAAGTWRITATHADFAPQTSVPLTVDGEHEKTGIVLALTAGGVVRGVVKDKAGSPVASAEVSIVASGYVFWRARRQTFSDASGAFAIEGLPRRALELVAQHATGSSAIVPVDLAATRTKELSLVLDVGGAIEGIVVDATGAPLGDAQVVAEPDWSGGTADRAAWSVRGSLAAVTDQAGAFRFAGLPDGAYRVRAARAGAPESALSLATAVITRPSTGPIKVVVRAEGKLHGKLALADGKVPALAYLSLGDTSPTPITHDGAFALTGAAGTHTLTISGPGFVQLRKQVTITEGKDTDLGTVTVTAGRSIAGRVLDATGAPVAKATVAAGTLLTGGGAELYIKDESIGARSTETDDDGRFVLDGFPPASLTVLAGKEDLGRSASLRLPPSTDSATLDLVLAPTTSLAGTITRNGAPLADTVVIASPVGAIAQNFFVATGPDGTFALDALAPDAYVVYPMLGGGGSRPKDIYVKRVDVELGKRAQVDIDASSGPASLTIKVQSDGGGPVAMAQVVTIAAAISPKTPDELRDGTLLPATSHVIPVYMRAALGGNVELEGLRPGVHTACAMVGGGPNPDPSSLAMGCTQVKIGSGKSTVTITVHAPKP